MAKISARNEEMRNTKCMHMHRLFSILDSQNGCATSQMISDAEPHDKFIIVDHPRTSFDEECRKIQYEADSARIGASERSLTREDAHILQQRNKDSDHLMECHKAARKSSPRGYESCSCQSNDSMPSFHKRPPASAETPSNKAAVVCTQKHCQEAKLSQGFLRFEKHKRVDTNLHKDQLSGFGYIFADRKLVCNGGARFEAKPFSNALEVLNSDKDSFFMELLSEPYCLPLPQNCIKNLQSCQIEQETFKKVSNTCPKSNGTVTLKAELQKRQHSGKLACHCSPGDGSSSRAMNGGLTSFSVREMKRKLKHTFGSRRKDSDKLPKFRVSHSRSIFGHGCIYSGVETRNPSSATSNGKAKEKLGRKQGLKVEREPLVDGEAETARKKIDVSSDILSEKNGADVALEAARDLHARLAKSNLQNSWRVISSKFIEMDSRLSPRRESQYFPGSAQVSLSPFRHSTTLSPMRTSKKVAMYDATTGSMSAETSSSLVPSTDEEAQEARISPTPNMKFNDMPNVVEADDIFHSESPHDTMISNAERAAEIKLYEDEYGSLMHPIMDSISENETFSNTVDESPSSPTLDMRDNAKYQEEYQSPVSVLDYFFAEDSTSPSNIAFQSARNPLKPRRLHFEEHNLASSSRDTPMGSNQCMVHDQEDYTISNYVRLIFEASALNWDQLSAIRPLSEHLLHPSLFDQAQFLQFDPHFDTRLLFDHVDEFLLETQQSHFESPYWPAFAKPRICSLPLEEAVVDEIMREAEFYLLPRTQRRTLDQLVAKDLSGPRSRPNLRPETEQIIVHISEFILEESVLDVILELHS